MEPIDKLYEKAKELAGRDVQVDKTADGNYIVLWFSHDSVPPKKGKSEEEALQNFIDLLLNRKVDEASIDTDSKES